MHYQLVNYLEHSNVLWVRQCGYRNRRSIELATAYLIEEIRKAADKGLITGVLFVDRFKAFDTLVGYSRLITKVQFHGIKGQALQWFTDYLFAPNQLVKFNNEISHKFTLICGAPQSSILGPVLFLIFF